MSEREHAKTALSDARKRAQTALSDARKRAQVEVRAARADEMEQFGQVGSYVYAGAFGDGPANVISTSNRPEWTLCAFIDGTMATSYSTFPFTMRVNGKPVSTGGVTAVGTLPEYRRQGLLRTITKQSFADMRGRGQSVAILIASQAAIYQRYGYTLASGYTTYRIDSADVGFADGDAGSSVVRRVPADEAYDLIKQIYIAFAHWRTCYLHRAKPLWLNNALSTNATTGPVHIAVAYDREDVAVGYVVYHVRNDKTGHPTRAQELTIKDFAWLTADAYRSLWSWLARHDLVGRIFWPRAPNDDPARDLFVEPRLLLAQWRDGIWLRLIDARVALAARGYDVEDSITIEVAKDDLAPWNEGRFELRCSPGDSEVRSAKTADLRLSIKALASLYCGYSTPRQLAEMGLLQADDVAIARAARIFATRHAPHCPDNF